LRLFEWRPGGHFLIVILIAFAYFIDLFVSVFKLYFSFAGLVEILLYLGGGVFEVLLGDGFHCQQVLVEGHSLSEG
jgi:hypothetical protein